MTDETKAEENEENLPVWSRDTSLPLSEFHTTIPDKALLDGSWLQDFARSRCESTKEGKMCRHCMLADIMLATFDALIKGIGYQLGDTDKAFLCMVADAHIAAVSDAMTDKTMDRIAELFGARINPNDLN